MDFFEVIAHALNLVSSLLAAFLATWLLIILSMHVAWTITVLWFRWSITLRRSTWSPRRFGWSFWWTISLLL
jgi:hypothetical protein